MKKLLLMGTAILFVVQMAQAQGQWHDWRKNYVMNCQTQHELVADVPIYGPTIAAADVSITGTPGSLPNDGDNEYLECSLVDDNNVFCSAYVYEDSCRDGWGNSRSKHCTSLDVWNDSHVRIAHMYVSPGFYWSYALGSVHIWDATPGIEVPGHE